MMLVEEGKFTAGKRDVADVALAFVRRLGPKDLGVAAQDAVLGSLQVQQRHAQPIQTPGAGSPDAVIAEDGESLHRCSPSRAKWPRMTP